MRRLPYWLYAIGAMAIGLGVCTALAGPGKTPDAIPSSPQEIEAAYKDLEKQVVDQLKDEKLWKDAQATAEGAWQDGQPRIVRKEPDPKKKEKLLALIAAAGALRSTAAISVLLDHIDYCLVEGELPSPIPVTELRPAVGALVKIGLPAVQPILDRAKDQGGNVNAEPGLPDVMAKTRQEERINYGLLCLVYLYGEGGKGPQMARDRIELEIKVSKPESVARLKEFLLTPAMKAVGNL